jgi:hypothetical protein
MEGFMLRTTWYTTSRLASFGYFYDWINNDPRRQARPDAYFMAGAVGGLVTGVLTNPVDIAFTRMQADEMYEPAYRRNYKNFFDAFIRTAQEGSLMKGAVANGLKYGVPLAVVTPIYDWLKEQSWYIYGPMEIWRILSCVGASIVAVAAGHPFDNLRIRMHTMRNLPDGRAPYADSLDAFWKCYRYEGNIRHNSNLMSIYAGSYAAFLRMFLILYSSMRVMDLYFQTNQWDEYWSPAHYSYAGGIDFDIHEPFTLAHHKKFAYTHMSPSFSDGAHHPDATSGITTI